MVQIELKEILCTTCDYGRMEVVYQTDGTMENVSILGVRCCTNPRCYLERGKLLPVRIKCSKYKEVPRYA